jgi:carbon storage regulator
MLVLSRKVGERVVIAGEIVVQVVEVSDRGVRLGIVAPRDVSVWREELVASQEAVCDRDGKIRKPR